MNIFDIIIIICILSAGYTGARNGFLKQSVVLVGTIIAFLLSWFLKDIVANFLSFNLPFFNFTGAFEGLTALNIVMYQLIAFMILLVLISSILIIVIKMTNIFEKIIKMTLVLRLPSKLLGFVVGVIEGYIIIFAILFFLSQPTFNITAFSESKMINPIINSSPILSNVVGKMNDSIKDIYEITKDYNTNQNIDKTNKEIINSLLEHKVIDESYLNKLREKEKINY